MSVYKELLRTEKCVKMVLVMAFVVVISGSAALFTSFLSWQLINEMFTPTEVSTISRHSGTYYVVPDALLDTGTSFVTAPGKRYYVLSEERLRLLGPEFLSTLSKGVDK